ncbi:thermonuclease family protein [Hyphomonas sp.]|uniref:thermonuclease family protein n=1 Tax=Hyphomonas sp. TaxID=87 RepID=UPI00391C240E
MRIALLGILSLALQLIAASAFAQSSTASFPKEVDQTQGRIKFEAPMKDRQIVDGDTIWMGIHEIRLYGIETVEPKQDCRRGRENVDCHSLTIEELKKHISDPSFRCDGFRVKDGKPWKSYGRFVALCYTDAGEVNLAMIESGWALAEKKDKDSI